MQHDLVFENDTLTRIGEDTYVTAPLAYTPSIMDLKGWASAAFANSSTLTAISLYNQPNNTSRLVLSQTATRNGINLKMQTELTNAMLPVETNNPDYMGTSDEAFVDADTLWVTTFINSVTVERFKGRSVVLPMSIVASASGSTRLAEFNHGIPVIEDGLVLRRVNPDVLYRKVEGLRIAGPHAVPIRVSNIGIYSDQLGTTVLTGQADDLLKTLVEMGAEYDDSIVLTSVVDAYTWASSGAYSAEVVHGLVGIRLTGIVI